MKAVSLALSIVFLAGSAAVAARADEVTADVPAPPVSEVPVMPGGGNYFTVPVTSLKMSKFKSIYLQQYDFSCGSAAVASLLTFHYHRPTSETTVFKAMWDVGNQDKIKEEGFSLLDMKNYLASIGLPSDGYEVSIDKLAEIKLPAITLIETNGYKHFVILKGVKEDRVLIGDPARGTYTEDRAEFESRWDKVALLVKSEVDVAQASFNREADWSAQPKAPIDTAFRQQGLSSFMLHLPNRF